MSSAAASRDSQAETVTARRRALLAWYDDHARPLPWRIRPSLYGTWISEIMLQQTTVPAVIPRWEAFLRRFPDVAALAAAEESEVLAEWTGLGYYRRARLLHRAAREVIAGGGEMPQSFAGWRALPGVGDYTAAAILSIGLGEVVAAVDANVRRVLTRWSCRDGDAAARLRPRDLAAIASDHVDPGRPGDWNQALMDLGTAICTSERPACGRCPVAGSCAAGRAGTTDVVPRPAKRPQTTEVVLGALILQRGRQLALLPAGCATVLSCRGLGHPRRRDLGGLLASTLCLPLSAWYAPQEDTEAILERAWARWLTSTLGSVVAVQTIGWIRHAITRYRLRVFVAAAELPPGSEVALEGLVWREPSDDWPTTTLVRRCLAISPIVGPSNDL